MDQLQAAWINDESGRLAEAERDELAGRTSGPAEWRAMRQELGPANILKPAFIR